MQTGSTNSLLIFEAKVCFVCYLWLKKKVHQTMWFLSLFTHFIPKLYDFHSSVEIKPHSFHYTEKRSQDTTKSYSFGIFIFGQISIWYDSLFMFLVNGCFSSCTLDSSQGEPLTWFCWCVCVCVCVVHGH